MQFPPGLNPSLSPQGGLGLYSGARGGGGSGARRISHVRDAGAGRRGGGARGANSAPSKPRLPEVLRNGRSFSTRTGWVSRTLFLALVDQGIVPSQKLGYSEVPEAIKFFHFS